MKPRPSPQIVARVPMRLRQELQCVLITQVQLARRVRELSRQIERDFAGRDLVVVSLLTGTVMFLADLIRYLDRKLVFTKELRLDVRGRDVLLVDDILDTGKTLRAVVDKLNKLKPRQIKTCVLLDKPAGRIETFQANYAGFVIPDLFVVGYGLDYAERYRNLPFVGVLKPKMYRV